MQGKADHVQCNNPKAIYLFGPDYQGEYTLSDGGVNPYESWSSDGMLKFTELMGWCKDARADAATVEFEDFIRKRLRADRGITALSSEEQHRNSRRKRPRNNDEEDDMEDLFVNE